MGNRYYRDTFLYLSHVTEPSSKRYGPTTILLSMLQQTMSKRRARCDSKTVSEGCIFQSVQFCWLEEPLNRNLRASDEWCPQASENFLHLTIPKVSKTIAGLFVSSDSCCPVRMQYKHIFKLQNISAICFPFSSLFDDQQLLLRLK